jgi:hypothetical protein
MNALENYQKIVEDKIKSIFKKLNIDCLVLVSEEHHWVDADADGESFGISEELKPDIRCIGINSKNKTAKHLHEYFSAIKFLDPHNLILPARKEKTGLDLMWAYWRFMGGGKTDNSFVHPDVYFYVWEIFYIDDEGEVKLERFDMCGEEDCDDDFFQKDNIPFLPISLNSRNYGQTNLSEQIKTAIFDLSNIHLKLDSFMAKD